ncbi:MAG: T9SS type A sorting domain-containing protein [candidate division WOR-3 bacterium]
MRSTVFALASICLLVGIAAGQSWVTGPQSPFGYTRFDGEYFPPTAKVYFLGGRIGNSTTLGNIYSYTPATGTYADVGVTMARAVSNYDVCLLRDDHNLPVGDTFGLYVVGGRYDVSPNYTDSLQVYYPISNTAITLPTDPFPGRSGGQITVAQSSIVFRNRIFTMGGFSQVSSVTTKEVWSFDPLAPAGSRWSRLADMPLARAYPILAIVDSFLFVCGGDTYSANALTAKAQCFRLNLLDTAAGWTTVASMPGANGESRGFGFDSDYPGEFAGKVIIAGRGTWSSESAHCYIYDVARDSWAQFPRLNQRRRNHAGVYIPAEAGGTGVPGIWVFGGRQDSDTNCLRISEYFLSPVGVAEQKARSAQLTVAPSLNRGTFRVRLSGSNEARLEVFDVLGKTVWSGLVSGEVRLAGLAAGTYVLCAQTKEGVLEQKVVVTH